MEKLICNLNELISDIDAICARCGRNPKDIEIVPASKFQQLESLLALKNDGRIAVFGENRVQEFLTKYTPELEWDIIGQLQTNKVKYVIDKVRLIQSVDRESLAIEIEKQATKINKIQDVLVEINSGAEENKGGILVNEAESFCESLKKFSHVRVVGLMAVAPLAIEREELKKLFLSVKEVYDKIATYNPNFKVLSMGMSGDYELAIECGSTMIRPGRVLFGERIYPTKIN